MDPYAVPSSRPPSSAGVETKQLLLGLGALCLTGALAAGTALIWSALGPGGQVTLMLAVTAALLVAAVALRRLPSTAEAVSGVGMAALVIDAIAARTLGLNGATALSLHVYVAVAAAAIGVVAASVAIAAPAVRSPLVAAALAPVAVAVAWVDPVDLRRSALLGPVLVAVAAGSERVLQQLGPRAWPARAASASGASLFVVVSVAAAARAAFTHDSVAWWGVLLVAMLFAVPELVGRTGWHGLDQLSAAACGVVSALIAGAAAAGVSEASRLAAVVVLPVLVVGAAPWTLRGGWARLRITADIAGGLLAVVAFVSLGGSEQSFLAANASLAVVALVTSLVWPRDRVDADVVRRAAAVAASVFGSIAAGLALDLRSVTTVEAYVATPALWWSTLALLELRRRPAASSALLLPGLLVGTLPTLSLALRPDGTRQVALLIAAATLVVLGAQLRWAAPMAVGAGELAVLVLRIVGPEVVQLPRWVTLGAIGLVLLTLGATWEARLRDVQRLRAGIAPRIAALR